MEENKLINDLSVAEKIELYNCLYEDLSGKGINGDTELAHVNVEEMAVLRAMGGSGTINPHTNLIQFGGGGGSPPPPPPATQTVTQQATIPEELKPFVTDVLEKSRAIQERREVEGYVPFSGPRIAEFAPEQTQAFESIKGLVGQGQQYFDPAARLTSASAFAPTAPQVSQFMNPYLQNVVDIQQREARRAADVERQQLGAQAVTAGGFGGSRQAILEAEQARNLQQQLGDIQTRGLAAAYEDAQARLQQQRERERLAGAQFATLGQVAPGQAFRELSALEAIGAQRQQQQQQALDIAQQEYEIARTFPERTLQDYQSIIRGYAAPIPASTVQRSQTTTPAPSFLQQAAGLGFATAGVGKALGGFKSGGLISLANGGRPQVELLMNMSDIELTKAASDPNFSPTLIEKERQRRRDLTKGKQQNFLSRLLPEELRAGKPDLEYQRRVEALKNLAPGDAPELPSQFSEDISSLGRGIKKGAEAVTDVAGQPIKSFGNVVGSHLRDFGTYFTGTPEQLLRDTQQSAKTREQLGQDIRTAYKRVMGTDRDDLMGDTFIKRGLTDIPQAGPMKGQVTDEERFRQFNKPEDLAAEQFAREQFARINKEDSVIKAGVDDEARKRILAGSATPTEIEQLRKISEEDAAERPSKEYDREGLRDMGSVNERTLTPREELLAKGLPDPEGRTNVMDDSPISLEETEAIGNLDIEEIAAQVKTTAQNANDVANAANNNISSVVNNAQKDVLEGNTNSANIQFMNELSDLKSRLSNSYGKEREALMKQLETKDRGTGLALLELGGAILAQDGGQTFMQALGKGLKDSKFTTKISNLDDRQKKLALGIARLDRQELQSEFDLTKAQADAVIASRKLDIQSRLADTEEQKAEITRRRNLMTFTSKFGTIDLNKEVGLSRAKELFKDSFTDEGGFTPKMKEVLKNKGYASERGTIFNNELDDILTNEAKMQVFANTFNRYIIAGFDPNLALQGAQISLINNLPTKSTKPKK